MEQWKLMNVSGNGHLRNLFMPIEHRTLKTQATGVAPTHPSRYKQHDVRHLGIIRHLSKIYIPPLIICYKKNLMNSLFFNQ